MHGSIKRSRMLGLRAVNRKQGRNDPCACGSGVKYKKCCGAATTSPPSTAAQPRSRDDDLRDSRYLLQLSWEAFVAEFTARLQTLLGKAIAPPVVDREGDEDARFDDSVYVLPMLHRPTAGWGGLPDNVVAYVRQSQAELVECLEDLAAQEEIVVVAEGFCGPIDSAVAAADPATLIAADGYGVAEFLMKNQHVPIVGGDIPPDLQTLNEEILRASTRMPGARPVFNAMQEFRNRYAIQVALRAARSHTRTPVLVFGLDHVEGIAYAARRLAADVRIKLIPTVAAQSKHLFEQSTPLR